MEYDVLGKNVDYIDFHNFLCKIDTGSITSMLHENGENLFKDIQENGQTDWNGHNLTQEELKKILGEEVGTLICLKLTKTTYGPETVLTFESGNQMKIQLRNQEQFAQIYNYLMQIKPA